MTVDTCLRLGSAEWRAWVLTRLLAHALGRVALGHFAGTC